MSSIDYRIHHGDCLEILRTLPDNSVHCVVTSPPYWGLRDYGHDGQIGLEETPGAYVARLVDVFREVRRVLREDGACWLNLGDSYASGKGSCFNPGGGENSLGKNRKSAGAHPLDRGNKSTLAAVGLKPKDLVGIPWRVAFALQADGWWLRQDIIWHKPNPMPESVRDRCTKAHEYVFLLTKSARYYYDAQAIAEPSVDPEGSAKRYESPFFVGAKHESGGYSPDGATHTAGMKVFNGTRNKRSVWTVTTRPYRGAHFATMPPALVELCIQAGSSAHGCCSCCGAPWERVMQKTGELQQRWAKGAAAIDGAYNGQVGSTSVLRTATVSTYETIGWQPTCTHEAERIPCIVLDPFAGSGTTLAVAVANGRHAVGIELNRDYLDLAHQRIGEAIAEQAFGLFAEAAD